MWGFSEQICIHMGGGNPSGQGKSHLKGSESELRSHKVWKCCQLLTLHIKTGSTGLGHKGFTLKVRNIYLRMQQ